MKKTCVHGHNKVEDTYRVNEIGDVFCDDDLQYIGQGTEYYENENMKFTGIYKKSFHFFYGARCYVAGKLYDLIKQHDIKFHIVDY